MKRKIMHYYESSRIYRVSAFGGKFLEYILKVALAKKEYMQICQSPHRF